MNGNIFSQAQMSKPPVNTFDLSHDLKLSFDMGELIPVLTLECLPGDYFDIKPENFLRFAPLVAPVMHDVIIDTHFFFVPNRLLWPEWEDWITGESEVEHPYTTANLHSWGRLADYLGTPAPGGTSLNNDKVSVLPVAAYFKIYDEFYRDQNLQAEAFVECINGNNYSTYHNKLTGDPYKRAWNHDYFTSCLPFAQKGDAVTLPVLNAGTALVEHSGSSNPVIITALGGGSTVSGDLTANVGDGLLKADTTSASIDPNETLSVDLSSDSVDLTTLRNAFALQAFLEKDARGGTRYIESVYSHFGVRSSDHRFHRPEYIGGVKQRMVISEVLSTAETLNSSNVVTSPVGQMAGHGVSVGSGNIRYRCEEHGFIMGIMSVRPRTAYQDGLHKMYTRFDRFDYAWPSFAHIGEQPVTIRELYWRHDGTLTIDDLDTVFGYIPRYSEYKYMNSRVAGDFRDTLDFWHLGRQFTSEPALNSNFIECDPDKRIFAVPSEDGVYGHLIFNIKASRRLPRFSTPSLMTY